MTPLQVVHREMEQLRKNALDGLKESQMSGEAPVERRKLNKEIY
jgi:hypothetical protein